MERKYSSSVKSTEKLKNISHPKRHLSLVKFNPIITSILKKKTTYYNVNK